MPRVLALLALAAAGHANQPAPPQPGARQVVDRSGVVWEPAWDQAGRQYFVDRATGRTSWQIDAAQGAPAAPAATRPAVSRLRPRRRGRSALRRIDLPARPARRPVDKVLAAGLVPRGLPDRAAPVDDLARGLLRRRRLVGACARDDERQERCAACHGR